MSLTAFILIVGVGIPAGIILSFVLVIKYGERMQAWMHWIWILVALGQIPRIYEGFESGAWRLGFWLAVTMFFLAVAMAIHHFREMRKQIHTGQSPSATDNF
ncbi:MAG: hypothetical protein LC732_03310 [Acidobacteria bacterium]|nr:hypothetical protein [Acidobacteriota bacterium]